MSGKVSHVMLTGPPGIGKTTVVKKVHQLLVRKGVTVKGFFTEELREDGRRVGFDIVSLSDGERKRLARTGANTGHKVGQYGVFVSDFEAVALPILNSTMPGDIVIIDEIGKMELFSRKFVDAAASLFERRSSDDVRVLCTIPSKSNHAFVSSLREREDRELVEVSRENRDTVPKIVTDMLYPDSK